jgi:hypothetical protein
VEQFRVVWAKFTKKYRGLKIHYSDLISLFVKVGPELGGFSKPQTKKQKNNAARLVFKMGLEQ